jgi:hypothetical protein
MEICPTGFLYSNCVAGHDYWVLAATTNLENIHINYRYLLIIYIWIEGFMSVSLVRACMDRSIGLIGLITPNSIQ